MSVQKYRDRDERGERILLENGTKAVGGSMEKSYDVIIVGARCAGSPTGMLLARKGYRVLIVDRATFPSDTVSTHVVHPAGVAALARWGLLGCLGASGWSAIQLCAFVFGPFRLFVAT